MATSTTRSPRRAEPLSRDRIVDAAIELLDSSGEPAVTVRAVTAHLATGRGAIYHHVADKDELLAAATDRVIEQVFAGGSTAAEPDSSIRAIAVGIFDALTAHPWVGVQLGRNPAQPAVRRIWLGLGAQLERIGVAGAARADAGAALVNYILGASAQYASGIERLRDGRARSDYLEEVAHALTLAEPTELASETAALLADHDDRQQFLAGVDIFLTGIAAR